MDLEEVASAPASAESRRRQLLEAALAVFARHGYRKTSMDAVAQAAGVSRQGLYLHFPNKEELFRAAVQHALRRSQLQVSQALAEPDASLEDRLVSAFDAWTGQFVEAVGSDVDDLVSACQTLLGPAVEEEKRAFAEKITSALEDSGLVVRYRRAGLSAADLATTMCATADGLKARLATRPEFVNAIRLAVRALCLPLRADD